MNGFKPHGSVELEISMEPISSLHCYTQLNNSTAFVYIQKMGIEGLQHVIDSEGMETSEEC